MKTLHFAAFGFTAAICIPALAFDHDGHNHGSYGALGGASESTYIYGGQSSFDSRNSCSPGGCPCSANNTDYTPRVNPSLPLPTFDASVTNRPSTRLEAELNRLADDLRYETRGVRGQAVLMEDLSQLRDETRHFEQSVQGRADRNHLRDDAIRVKRSLIQLDMDMQRGGRLPESERSLLEVAQSFAAMVDDLGLTQRTPDYRSVPPMPPTDDPRGNGLTPPIGTPRPLSQSVPPFRPLTQTIPKGMEGLAKLSAAEQASALAQGTCPVTKQKLGSMGKPIRVTVAGRSLWVCCQGCVNAVKSNPSQYFPGL